MLLTYTRRLYLQLATISGNGIKELSMSFDIFTYSIEELRYLIKDFGITNNANDIMGVYFKPIFNTLNADFKVILFNAQQLKKVRENKSYKRIANGFPN